MNKILKRATYPVLETEIAARGIRKCDIAESMVLTPEQISMRLHDKTKITVEEAIHIRDKFFPDMSVEDLFRRK